MHKPVLDVATVKDAVRRHWAIRAATFDDAPNHGLHTQSQADAWQLRLRRWAGPKPVDVLDIGCGTGFLALQLAGLGHRVLGIDAAQEMLALAQAKNGRAGLHATFQQADAERLLYKADTFDLVVERHGPARKWPCGLFRKRFRPEQVGASKEQRSVWRTRASWKSPEDASMHPVHERAA
jgi:SAM-dependent methyltransferase